MYCHVCLFVSNISTVYCHSSNTCYNNSLFLFWNLVGWHSWSDDTTQTQATGEGMWARRFYKKASTLYKTVPRLFPGELRGKSHFCKARCQTKGRCCPSSSSLWSYPCSNITASCQLPCVVTRCVTCPRRTSRGYTMWQHLLHSHHSIRKVPSQNFKWFYTHFEKCL